MGSAAAVASRWADIGLGTDTGGSIRVPASYCGLYGMRPSHGAVSRQGLIGLAPRFDTVGWFTTEASLLQQVGQVLLESSTEPHQSPARRLLVDPFLHSLLSPECASALQHVEQRLSASFTELHRVDLGLEHDFTALNDVFRVLQGRAIADCHGDWIRTHQPRFSDAVAARLNMAMALTDDEVQQAEAERQRFTTRLDDILQDDAVLMLPTTPTTAPMLGEDTGALRPRLLTLTAIAGLTGSAQVHLPLWPLHRGQHISQPYGFSLMQRSGRDQALLSLVQSVTDDWNQGL